MVEQQQGQDAAREERLRRAAGAAFGLGLVATLVLLAVFPGLPHVFDWGAVVFAALVGGLARWACLAWMRKRHGTGG
ncbi:hypothetical protein [Streptomyces fructofermentans]|uniref:Uncharacterized protein n=1 Tax=Streptomyces fructofermentans TaxID=152141 RepID=A0A918NL55_9ACTN|nr:hypothetical protein [Streptomyces fructofermentans]GGX77993.1 hypothetical protein GCM10010515_52360 [Streptomyces fructofermentans]